jgi:hypothetical protein
VIVVSKPHVAECATLIHNTHTHTTNTSSCSDDDALLQSFASLFIYKENVSDSQRQFEVDIIMLYQKNIISTWRIRESVLNFYIVRLAGNIIINIT